MKAHTFILLALSCSSSRGEIDLNVKSDKLKHILSPSPQDSTSSSTSTKVSASQHNFISLDLAGEIQTHVSSPYENDEQSVNAKPLFHWGALGKKKIPIPNVHIGAQYDFRRHWFGVTRFISTLSWGQSKDDTFSMKIRGEMGHDLTEDYSVQWNLETNHRKGRSLKPKLMTRFDTKHGSRGTTVAASAAIHPRLNIVAKVIAVSQGSSSNYDELRYQQALIHRVPQEKLNWSEGTWLPDVKMTTGGKIIASSAIGLPRGGKSNGNDVAVRLMARRQMDWNIVGLLNGSSEDYVRDDESQTILRLEVGSKGNDSLSYSSISAEAALENIRNSWKCTVQQERLIQL